MIDVESYIQQLITLLTQQYGSRLLYVGLQGSYLREEATDDSDLDIMVVIDKLSVADLDRYRAIIQTMAHYDKSCGFICSKSDLASWNSLEIFSLLNSTKDYLGILRELVPPFTKDDIKHYIKVTTNNLYHEICHRYIHADQNKNINALPDSYKTVFFILQNLYYLWNGEYIQTKPALLNKLTGIHRTVLERSIELKNNNPYNFTESFHLLFTWCQEVIKSIE